MWVLEKKKTGRLIRRSVRLDEVLTIEASYNVDSDNHENAFDRTGKYTKIKLACGKRTTRCQSPFRSTNVS
jgi:hypothetical protein